MDDVVDEFGFQILKISPLERFRYSPNCGTFFAYGLFITDSPKVFLLSSEYAFIYSSF